MDKIDRENKTAKDAFRRMDTARCASLANPTLPYLRTLLSEVKDWTRAIEAEIARLESGQKPL